MTINRVGMFLVAAGLVLAVIALLVGFPRKVDGGNDSVYVVRGPGASGGAKLTGPISPSDGNLWFGAAVPTILIGTGLVIAARRRPAS